MWLSCMFVGCPLDSISVSAIVDASCGSVACLFGVQQNLRGCDVEKIVGVPKIALKDFGFELVRSLYNTT